MRKTILFLALLTALAACGEPGARSAGSLTIPPADTSTTSTTSAASTASTVSGGAATTSTTKPGDSSSPTTTSIVPAQTIESTVTIYLLDEEVKAVPVARVVEGPAVARGAVEALVVGPSRSEEATGLGTAFPPDSLVLGLTIDGGTATVDMSLEFETGGGSASILGRLAQLVYTLTEFDNVERVRLLVEGEAVEHFSAEGVVVSEPLTRRDYAQAVPLGGDRPATAAPTWDQDDLAGQAATHRVVLVAADDFLNVRERPGVEARIVGRLLPGVAISATGDSAAVGTSSWREIGTPAGNGWVNGFYLEPIRAQDAAFEAEALDLVEALSQRFATGADFTDLVSARGLWVAHHAPPLGFDREELSGILGDPTTYRWGSNALEPGSSEIRPRTFAEAVADRFRGVFDDPDRTVLMGELVEGPNGRPPEFALPGEFTGFPFATVFDPGDEPEYDGLDWTTWIVSFSHEEGGLRVVGLTLDEWAP